MRRAALLDSYHEERHEAAQQNVLVTNRTARFLRPADGAERLFRTAALGLARQYPFARQFVNTGRMAIANPYTRSSVCDATGGQSVQNVAFQWPDGSKGVVNDLLLWADGRLLLLVFGDPGRTGARAPARPGAGGAAALRAGAGRRRTGPARWSTCATRKAICRAPATCSAMPGRWCGPTATWPPRARASMPPWSTPSPAPSGTHGADA